MGQPVMTFAARRWLSLSILIVFSLLALAVDRAYSSTLLRSQFLSGSVLLAAIVFLAVYNVRKKLPFLPLGSSSVWLQVHLNVGWFSILLFLLHVGFRAPNGPLETTLALLYLGAAASGVFGLRISRRFAPRLARHGEEVIFERIPELRRRLREEAEALVVRSAEEGKSTTIADFYADRLLPFFAGPRNFWLHLLQSNGPLHALLEDSAGLRRYLNEKQKRHMDDLVELVRQKDHLDHQYALQAMLKRWLFFHVPLTYCLLILALAHVVFVYAFSVGNP